MTLAYTFLAQHFDAVIVIIGALGAVWLNAKGKTGDALEYYERANQVLAQQNRELMEDHKEYLVQISELKRKTDFDAALAPVLSGQRQADERADKRHHEAMGVFNLIAQRLGPED